MRLKKAVSRGRKPGKASKILKGAVPPTFRSSTQKSSSWSSTWKTAKALGLTIAPVAPAAGGSGHRVDEARGDLGDLTNMKFAVFLYPGVEPIDLATFGVLSMARRIAPQIQLLTVAPEPGPVVLSNGLTVLAQYGVGDCPAPWTP